MLIDRGAGDSAQDDNGQTGLHRAARRGQVNTISLLNGSGTAIDVRISRHCVGSDGRGC